MMRDRRIAVFEFFQFFSFPVLKKRNQDLDYVINKGNMLPIEG